MLTKQQIQEIEESIANGDKIAITTIRIPMVMQLALALLYTTI